MAENGVGLEKVHLIAARDWYMEEEPQGYEGDRHDFIREPSDRRVTKLMDSISFGLAEASNTLS